VHPDLVASYNLYGAQPGTRAPMPKRGEVSSPARGPRTAPCSTPRRPRGIPGAEALSDYIEETHRLFPGLVVEETSKPELLGRRLRVSWVARQGETAVFTGTDFVEFDDEGHVARVTMFYDSAP
jgi:hypothetical protein